MTKEELMKQKQDLAQQIKEDHKKMSLKNLEHRKLELMIELEDIKNRIEIISNQ